MTFFDGMTDAALDAEIERLEREIAYFEECYDAEYRNDDAQGEFNQGLIGTILRESIANLKIVMNEKRRRMGYWIAP